MCSGYIGDRGKSDALELRATEKVLPERDYGEIGKRVYLKLQFWDSYFLVLLLKYFPNDINISFKNNDIMVSRA